MQKYGLDLWQCGNIGKAALSAALKPEAAKRHCNDNNRSYYYYISPVIDMKVIVCLAVLDVDGVGGVGQLLVCHRVDAQHPGLLVPQLTATNN